MNKYLFANTPRFDSSLVVKAEEAAKARNEALRKKEESWERSDTDGFLSQWASGLSAQKASREEELYRNGGLAVFTGLYEGDRRVVARTINTRYGYVWMLDADEAARFGRKFVPIGDNSRVQKKLGLSEREETQPAGVGYDGSGTGLSGSCYVVTYRKGDKWGREASLYRGEDGEILYDAVKEKYDE